MRSFIHSPSCRLSRCLPRFIVRSLMVWLACLYGGLLLAQSTPPDADLYYRRTHDGALPPAGVNPSDHSAETTNIVAALALPPQTRPQILRFNNVDPANLGKGDWIWQMPATETTLGVADVQSVINYEVSLGMQWITVKCGDGGSIWTQFNSDLITRAHAAGLKIFGWAYVYGNNSGHYGSTSSANVSGEISVAQNALALGADGLIIDAEIEYETNATRVADAILYAGTLRTNYPNNFLAHAPFPYIASHSGFPYIQFGIFCDAVMPQDYWGAIGISPQTMVVNMNTQWRNWQNGLTGANTNAIKPIVPLGQSYAPVTGAQITQFALALQTNTPAATVGGYNGISFWDAQERNADMNGAVAALSGNTNTPPYFYSQPLPNRMADTGATVNFNALANGALPLFYQWYFNNAAIPAATNTTYILTGINTNNTGKYFAVATNVYGSSTSSVVTLSVYPPLTTVFADNFDTNSASNWTVNKSSTDTEVLFNYDYSTNGISSAPHSTGGTTYGLRLEANLTAGVVSALSVSPANQVFSGDYRLHFDMWINVNGPFPGGGSSSTEFLTAGLGTAGNRVEWTGAGSTADGFYFSADGDGGVSGTSTTSGDYCAYAGTALEGTGTGIYAAGTDTSVRDNGNAYYQALFPIGLSAPAKQQSKYAQQNGVLNAGTAGFAWHDVIVARHGSTVDWVMDGVRFASISNVVLTASNVFVGYWDPFASLTDNTNLSFGLVDNVRVEVPAVVPLISVQPFFIQTLEGLRLTGNGQSGATYDIQTSTNLVNWVTQCSQVATNGAFEFDLLRPSDQPQLFYRVYSVP